MRSPASLRLAVCAAALGLAACGGDDKPPPKVAHESAGAMVLRVGTRWGDTVEDKGFLQNDPNGVVEFDVTTTRTLTLGEGGAAKMRVERDELFKTRLGNFHCKAKGDLAGTATYRWDGGEAEVRVELPEASLPRTCDQAGFPVTAKSLPPSTMLLVLRSDRLIGKTSARDRTVLLPMP